MKEGVEVPTVPSILRGGKMESTGRGEESHANHHLLNRPVTKGHLKPFLPGLSGH